ncbi:DUF4234 domain-containing protein [Butyrivibrio sp. X503]|uniref:DUF4234 domain-containing protein n=1 Tax=Butyrivibrio sp. X503 TaxID=2364878 RepID=UPI000EA83B35|nr:DUF4234 domain-containing protein [Butyrivibrio sp. X503]RKM55614.1 DUF4234 domain-containing protein [Butyrivibrio sp. X503]
MFCKNCGHELPEGTTVCPNCGKEVEADTIQQLGDAANKAFNSAEQDFTSAINDVTNTFNGNNNAFTGNAPLNTDRNLFIVVLLTIITCGIYAYYFTYTVARDMNITCAGDGEETPGLVAYILLSMVTCGIYSYYWYYKVGNRLSKNAPRYGMTFEESGTTVLLWMVVGTLLCGVGVFIALYIVIKNLNAICEGYNRANGYSF